jgi:hypothetical protein
MGLSSTSNFWSICNWECMDKLDMNLSLVLMVKDQTSTTHRMWTCCILCCNSATISFDKLKPLKSIVYDKFVSKSEYKTMYCTWSHQRTSQENLVTREECHFGWLLFWTAFHWSGYLSFPPAHPSIYIRPSALHLLAACDGPASIK